MVDVADLRADHFVPLKHGRFRITLEDGDVEITLAAIKSGDPSMRAGGAFSLLWQGPAEPLLEQGVYPLVHEALGQFNVFIVPIGRTAQHATYQAVFN